MSPLSTLRISVSLLLASALITLPILAKNKSATPSPAAAQPPLAVHAALVLTPEFCATKTKKGTWGLNQESFPVGKTACEQLEPDLKGTFTSLTKVEDPAAAGDAQVVLTPKFVDVSATQAKIAFSNREVVVQVEWTAKSHDGKTVWLETVQGSAKHHIGNAFTYNKNLHMVVRDAINDMAQQTATKMAASPEMQKVD